MYVFLVLFTILLLTVKRFLRKDCEKYSSTRNMYILAEMYGKPFYYLLGNVDILFIYKISYKVYKISNIYQISYILY